MENNLIRTVEFLAPIHHKMERVEELMRSQAEGCHPALDSALHHLLSSGGKRIRPALALLMGGLLGCNSDKLVTLAAAIELLHAATLVHDDLIDGAVMRRGKATLNSQWPPSAAVLTGDFIFSRAAKLAAQTESIYLINLFAETLTIIVNGEITQLFESQGLADREDYYKRIYAKTASLFELATSSPAVLCHADELILKNSRRFGREIGLAFQIVDDVLDFTSDQSKLGKPVAGDLRQGLITLPALYYIDENPNDPDLKQVMQRNFLDEQTIGRLVKSIRESHAIQRSMDEARRHIDQSLMILNDFPDCAERRALEDLARFHVQRDL